MDFRNQHGNNFRYYDDVTNALRYKERTDKIDISDHISWVLQHLQPTAGKCVLDLGCGPGRDTAHFLEKGLKVTSVDASPAMIELTRAVNSDSHVMRMEEIPYTSRFDLIWASASILHLPRGSFFKVFQQIRSALRVSGLFYASFKLGNGSYVDDTGRAFTLVSESDLLSLMNVVGGFETIDIIKTESKTEENIEWINILARKAFEPGLI